MKVDSSRSSNVHPLPRYRKVPNSKSSIGETFLGGTCWQALLSWSSSCCVTLFHCRKYTLLSSSRIIFKILMNEWYGIRSLCRKDFDQRPHSGFGSWIYSTHQRLSFGVIRQWTPVIGSVKYLGWAIRVFLSDSASLAPCRLRSSAAFSMRSFFFFKHCTVAWSTNKLKRRFVLASSSSFS